MPKHPPHFYIIIALLLYSVLSVAQTTISIDSISTNIGQSVKVCDKVFSTHVTKGEKPVTFLNLGAEYPDQKLTLVIFYKDRQNFVDSPEEYYKEQDVCATGVLKIYKGRVEMVTSTKDQIQIMNGD